LFYNKISDVWVLFDLKLYKSGAEPKLCWENSGVRDYWTNTSDPGWSIGRSLRLQKTCKHSICSKRICKMLPFATSWISKKGSSMQRNLRKLAKRIVANREKLPSPVYNWLRATYRKGGKLLSPRTPSEFNDAHYLQTNPNIDYRKLTPYDHFRKVGHTDLRSPNPDFDIVWYLQNYGHTFDVSKIDPFSHYLKRGKSRGNTPHPPRKVKFSNSSSHRVI